MAGTPRLDGQVALVTGGGRGVGRAIAVRLAEAGASVGLVARSRHELEDAASELEGYGVGAVALAGDVRDESFVAEAAAAVAVTLGPVDLLVNGAGTARAIGPLWELDPGEWWADVETNLLGTFLFARAVLPTMVERRGGRIVNVSSYSGTRPSPYLTAYAAAKAALLNLTESLACETEPHGVRVFAVTPGYVPTAMIEHIVESPEGRRWLPHVRDGKPVDPSLVADLVAFLASGAADGLNGRFLHALDDARGLARRADAVRDADLYVVRLRRAE